MVLTTRFVPVGDVEGLEAWLARSHAGPVLLFNYDSG